MSAVVAARICNKDSPRGPRWGLSLLRGRIGENRACGSSSSSARGAGLVQVMATPRLFVNGID